MSESELVRRLRDAADTSEKGLPFVEGDDDLVADIEDDITLKREAADELERLQDALEMIASPNRAALATGRDAIDMASYAKEALGTR